jgi:hypothetical protein
MTSSHRVFLTTSPLDTVFPVKKDKNDSLGTSISWKIHSDSASSEACEETMKQRLANMLPERSKNEDDN